MAVERISLLAVKSVLFLSSQSMRLAILYRAITLIIFSGALATLVRGATLPSDRQTVGVYVGAGTQTSTAKTAIQALSDAGYKIVTVPADDATGQSAVSINNFFLYLIADASSYPAQGFDGIAKYLSQGGNLITIGAPAFDNPIRKIVEDGKATWMDATSFQARINGTKAKHIVLDFKTPINWAVEAGDPKLSRLRIGSVAGGITGQCLQYQIDNIYVWASAATSLAPGAFPIDHQLLCLWAKGDKLTPSICFEIDEADGSRWMCALPVTEEWKHYAIPFAQFSYWRDSATGATRGYAGDHLNPAKAINFKVGLAQTHVAVSPGPHRFWVDEIGTAPGQGIDIATNPPPTLETISPKYKVYPMTGVNALRAAAAQEIIPSDATFSANSNLWSGIRRPQGQGYTGQNPCRWMPLIDAFAGDNSRGSVASLLINHTGVQAGSVCASFDMDSLSPELASSLVDTVKAIGKGLFLFEAGSQYSSYYPSEGMALGARVLNESNSDETVLVRMTMKTADKILWQDEKKLAIPARKESQLDFTATAPAAGSFTLNTDLIVGGKSIDTISQPVVLLPGRTHKSPSADFVTVQGSDFFCQGKKWYPYGVNFWPRYDLGLENSDQFMKWLEPGFYNPEGIEDDLNRIERMGLTAISVQMYPTGPTPSSDPVRPGYVRNLMAFLDRCAAHHLKVNGFLPHASPMARPGNDGFDSEMIAAFFKETGIADNPTLFAYDFIWEPGYQEFNDQGRKAWSQEWNQWVIERYDRTENALADWGFAPQQADGQLAPPTAEQMSSDGDWRIYVAAYRRFMDDFTSRRWAAARRSIKQYDPIHLISYRQGNTTAVDFGLTGPIKHIDFVSPEGYTFSGDASMNGAGFVTRYIHFTTEGKPVFWAEFGQSIWDKTQMQPDAEGIKGQGNYIAKFYQTAYEAGANGLSPWWWPGGYRVDEGSDFGVTNPDGTLRPSAEAMLQLAVKMTTDRSYPEPTQWLVVDRDANAGGYWDLANSQGAEAYGQARAAGGNLGIKTLGTGTDSTNTPLIAVGNVAYNGQNPPKYLNAEFNRISVKSADGAWVDLHENNQEIPVMAGKPVIVRASIGNLGEAKWIAPNNHPGAGGVYLSSRTGDLIFRVPINDDASHLQDAETSEFILSPGLTQKTKVVFEMTALDRMWFGEKFKIVLKPTATSG
jgi:hypothetical protein